MAELDWKFWLQVVIYAATFASMSGKFSIRLDYLERKMDKHNNLQDRMAVAEQSIKSAHKRMDELRDEMKEESKWKA